MEFKTYQKFVKSVSPRWTQPDSSIITTHGGPPNANVFWAITELASEAGECLSLGTKSMRKSVDVDKIKLWDELGDTLWGIAAVMNEAFPERSIEELMTYNKEKLEKRLESAKQS